MKRYALIGVAAGALMFLPQVGFTQTYSSDTNPRPAVTNPNAAANNTLPTHSGVGTSNASQTGRADAVYVKHEIAKAKSEGKDVARAQTHYNMGMTALDNGLNREASQHFDEALRSVGVQPKVQGQNAGEPMPPHASMPGNTHP